MKTSESVDKLFAALITAQAEMGNAIKDSKNPFFKSKYADINSIREAALPVLTKHGLGVFQPPATFEGKNYIETLVVHTSGQYMTSLNEVVVGKQNDPQSFLAAQTYSRRGALQAVLNMGSEDDDGNSISGRTVNTFHKVEPKQNEVTPSPATVTKLETDFLNLGGQLEAPKKKFGGFKTKTKPNGDVY